MPAITEMRISDLNTASILDESDLLEISKVNGTSASGYMSYKTTLFAIALYVTKLANYTSDLQTTNKTVIGAINELKQLISLIPRFSIEVVETLPTEDISVSTLYLVPSSDPETGNYYEEYIYVNDAWEMVGTTAVDLSDYYTKTQVDTLLNDKVDKISGKGLSTNDFINNARYPDLTAGKSLSLVTKTYGVEANDSAPYIYRQFPASASNSKYEKLKKIVGVSVVWNQLVSTFTTRSSNGVDATIDSNHVITFSGKGTASWAISFIGTANNVVLQNNHVYFATFGELTADNNAYVLIKDNDNNIMYHYQNIKTSYVKAYFFKATNTGKCIFSVTGGVDVSPSGTIVPLLVDLTAMLGSTIADYVMSLGTMNQRIAWLKSYGFFTEEYYAYSANTIQSVSVSGHKVVGKNLFGGTPKYPNKVIASDGSLSDSNSYDTYEFLGGVNYILNLTKGTNFDTLRYARLSNGVWTRLTKSTFPLTIDTTTYERLRISIGKTDFATDIQLEMGTTATAYEPYHAETESLDHTTLRGIFYLDNGELKVDGDIYNADGSEDVNYEERAYESGDESLPDTITDGTTTVTKKATPTTAALTPFNSVSEIEQGGTEEFIDYKVSQGNRDVSIPAGTDTDFYEEVETVMPLPNVPFEDGTYMLTAEVEDNEPVFKFARITT